MATSRKAQYKQELLKLIEEKDIKFITDIFAYYGKIVRSDFYRYEFHKDEEIMDLLDKNKVISRNKQLINWEKSDNPVLQIALFRLTCTDEQRKKISTNYNENQTTLLDKDGNNYTPTINVVLEEGDIK